MRKTFFVDGSLIHDIPTLYDEINRVFMVSENWKLGPSLDAFNDMLYGGYGAIKGDEPVDLIWLNFEQNKKALGIDTTRTWYLEKLKSPSVFNSELFMHKLEALENGAGQTYFDILLEIISGHRNITLIPR